MDILRSHVVRILDNIERLRQLSSADTVRAGPNQLTLAEVKASLEDLLRFGIEPLFSVANGGLSKQAEALRQYVDNQLLQTRLK
jgi:hypothetical protein